MNFLEKLDFLMNKYNLNKHTFSQASGIPYTTIDGFYKKGYEGCRLSTLEKIRDYFNTSLDYLMDDSIEDPNYGRNQPIDIDGDEARLILKYRELSPRDQETIRLLIDRHLSDG